MATASYVIAIETYAMVNALLTITDKAYAMVNGLSVTAYGLSAVTDEFPAMVFHLFTAPDPAKSDE